MNKTWTYFSLTLALYGTTAFGSVLSKEYRSWTGFYIGGNAGYLWSSNNIIKNDGRTNFANPLFSPNSRTMSFALADLGTRHLFNSSKGFIGGGQIGYNSQFSENLVIGIDADLDAIGQSNGTTNTTNSVSTALLGTLNANIVNTKKLNYVGLLKGRLGVLVGPSFLLYGSGAFAYGGGSLKTSYSVTETNSAFPSFYEELNASKLLAGWAAGGGAELLFSPCWSMKVEYIYYQLGPLHTHLNLTQNIATTPPASFAGAIVDTSAKFTENTIRVGLNYFFS
ncbi:outer membrane protein [Legionella maioricensis]|uniref:Outer membrane beta-barrel protein n=1 Tax=Legionella maioricensis TaxID=2896528 RepID=A0A9X2IBZ3_9GAMM|nr:outer membrane beta-barrel protein [Legionella maioricensis]MCL9684741.1 outer membrane beta-barrel protein [Legionella maioricensis]MCL9687769.1 outer membrane beta-barrel protein [Legionella maioricensis]